MRGYKEKFFDLIKLADVLMKNRLVIAIEGEKKTKKEKGEIERR